MIVASIGYQGRSLEALYDALSGAGVRVLIDVRLSPWSQRPEFRKGRLQEEAVSRSIRYVHCKAAGNPHRPKRGEPVDPQACEAAYSEHLAAHPEVIEEIDSIAQGEPVALLCYEAHRDHCHRGVIIDALRRRIGRVKVVDL